MKPNESLRYFQSLQTVMLEQVLRYVRMESPTTVKEAVDRFGEEVSLELKELEMSMELDPQPVRGNHLIARWPGPGPKILLVGHLDTVWELGIFKQMPVRVEGDIAYGPGIYDMKGGIVIALHALRLLKTNVPRPSITFLLNSDEEEGSETSRALIEREAADAACAFILEPGGPDNGVKTRRRGVGRYEITVRGRSAHAGVEPEKGVNAIEELAHHILTIQSWNRERSTISVNVGIIQGGTRTNVIPAEARCIIDVRCDQPDDMEWIREKFHSLRPVHPEAKLIVEGDINRPPLVRSDKVLVLYQEAAEIAKEFNYPIREYWTGGGSDGNFTSALGVPTLDGLGPEGQGAHALHEQIIISSLPKRANLLYQLIRRKIENRATARII